MPMVELSAAEKEFMKKKYFASLAVVSPKTDKIYNTTVWLHYDETRQKFYMITNRERAKWRHLRDGTRQVGVNIFDPKGWPYISLTGTVDIYFEEDRDDFWEIVMDVIRKYNAGDAIESWRKRMEDAGNRMLLELEPENMYSSVR